MEKLTIQDYNLLLELLEQEKESIHQQAIRDNELRERELDLDFISIKINTIIKQKEDKLDYLINKLEG